MKSCLIEHDEINRAYLFNWVTEKLVSIRMSSIFSKGKWSMQTLISCWIIGKISSPKVVTLDYTKKMICFTSIWWVMCLPMRGTRFSIITLNNGTKSPVSSFLKPFVVVLIVKTILLILSTLSWGQLARAFKSLSTAHWRILNLFASSI